MFKAADDYITPSGCLIDGFDCLASYLAKQHPGLLHIMEGLGAPEEVLRADEAVLLRLSAKFGLPVHYVPASPAFVRAGREQQPAFQVGLLMGMVGTDFCLGSRFSLER